MNDSNERRPSFHLGGNDDDLSDDSPPRTSPTSKQIGDGESLKRVNLISRFCFCNSIFFLKKGFKSIKISEW